MTAQGDLIEMDGTNGKEIRRFRAGQPGGWLQRPRRSQRRYLIANMNVNGGHVSEVDDKGAKHWQAELPRAPSGPSAAEGNTLVVSMTTRKVAELDREGRVRWEVTCTGRPWCVTVR